MLSWNAGKHTEVRLEQWADEGKTIYRVAVVVDGIEAVVVGGVDNDEPTVIHRTQPDDIDWSKAVDV